MSVSNGTGLGPLQDAARGLKLLQPEMNALMQKVGVAERTLEEREVQLNQDRAKLEEEKKAFYEQVGAEKQKLREEADKHAYEMKWERHAFNKEKEHFYEAESRGREISAQQDPVTVEVGGEKFRTEIRTLAKCKGSLFPVLVEPLNKREGKRDPYIFIDRDGRHFRFILNYLRQGEKVMRWPAMKNLDISTLNEILDEVEYYKIAGLEKLLRRKVVSLQDKFSFEALVKAKYFQRESSLGGYKTTIELTLRDINLTGIVFTKVRFCHPVKFENCCMKSAKFSECYFEKVMSFANVDLFRATFMNCEGIKDLSGFGFMDTDISTVEVVPPGKS